MIIIVTGAAGFIGTNFVYYMLRRHPEYSIIGYDALTYAGNISNLAEAMHHPSFRFIKGDIRDREAVKKLFSDFSPDIIVNFAAESHVDRSIDNPAVFLDTNIVGTSVLLDACRDFGIRRFHQVSTDEVYGDLPLGRPDLKFTEDSPLKPSSPYSASKAAADLLTLSYHRTYGLDATVSRCSNNFGPYQHPEKLIPKTICHAMNNKEISVYGSGENVRDWIYVEDHCRAVDAIIHNGTSGEIYNIGADNEICNLILIRKILSILGKPETLISFTADRKGHDLRYAIDSSRLSKELGVTFKHDFSKRLEETVGWYADQFCRTEN